MDIFDTFPINLCILAFEIKNTACKIDSFLIINEIKGALKLLLHASIITKFSQGSSPKPPLQEDAYEFSPPPPPHTHTLSCLNWKCQRHSMAIKTPERLVTPLGVNGNGAIYTFMSFRLFLLLCLAFYLKKVLPDVSQKMKILNDI